MQWAQSGESEGGDDSQWIVREDAGVRGKKGNQGIKVQNVQIGVGCAGDNRVNATGSGRRVDCMVTITY